MYRPRDDDARGIWGLQDREYTDEEVQASFHLQSAVHAGALVTSDQLVTPDDPGDKEQMT